MTHAPAHRGRTPDGFTLLELMVVLAVLSALALAASQRALRDNEAKLSKAMAGHIQLVGEALKTYITNNSATLAAAPSTTLTIAQLQAVGSCNGASCLVSTFQPTTSWTTGYSIQVNRLGTSPYQYEALVCTTSAVTINGKVRIDIVGDAVNELGMPGGMTYDTTGVFGQGGGWNRPVASFSFANAAGKLCYFISQSMQALDQQYLRLDGGNRMLGQLDLNNNALVNGTTLTASGLITGGSMKSNTTIDATGVITGGTLTSNGDVNVAAGGRLASTGRLDIQSGDTLYLQPAANGSGSQVVVGGSGGSGSLSSTSLAVSGSATVGADITAGANVIAQNDVRINTLTARGSAPNTTSVKALLPSLVEVGSFIVTAHGQSIPVPACDAGGQPRVFVIPQTLRGQVVAGNWGGDVRAAGPAGGPWTVIALDNQNNPLPNAQSPTFQALGRTFCAY